eukprot:878690-Prorocentrum_minimum.AAC.1
MSASTWKGEPIASGVGAYTQDRNQSAEARGGIVRSETYCTKILEWGPIASGVGAYTQGRDQSGELWGHIPPR